MDNNQDRRKLKLLYEELKNSSFPKFSKKNDISDWIENLIEIDAHYAGLSLSASEGEIISKNSLCDISKLKNDLVFVKTNNLEANNIDVKIINDCSKHLEIIQNIHIILKKISN